MDGKGFEDDGLGERYPYASEPDETEDPLPLRRPGHRYVSGSTDDIPLGLPSRPHEPGSTPPYQGPVGEYRYDPELLPTEPYVGGPRAVRPYVTGLEPADPPPDPPAPPPTGLGSYGSPSSEAPYEAPYEAPSFEALSHEPSSYGSSSFDAASGGHESGGNGYESAGYESSGYGGTGYGGNGSGPTGSGSSQHGYGEHGSGEIGDASDRHGAPVYRGRARAQSQSYAAGYEAPAAIEGSRTYESYPPTEYPATEYPASGYPATGYLPDEYPARPTRGGYGAVGGYDDQPVPEFVTRPGYSLTEDLAEQRRQDARRDEDGDREDDRTHMPLWQELPLLLVVAFCVAVLIRSCLVQAFFIPSSSMEQTLLVGDRVLVNKILYDVRSPERGEVVVFRGTDRWAPENYGEEPGSMLDRIGDTLGDLVGVSRPGEKDFIKRVIGLPGDRVACCDAGRVTVNGVAINEPYINADSSLEAPPNANVCGSRQFAEVVVPEGQLFVMGDNRAVSQDSRCQGPVPIENVIGRAFVIVWPSERWDTLSTPDTFDGVPAPAAAGPIAPARPDPVGAVVALPILASLVGSSWPRLRRRQRARRLRR